MTGVLAKLDPAVPLSYTVSHTNNRQTLTALASICHQVNVHKQKMKNPPPGFDKWEIIMNNYKEKVEQVKKFRREPQKLQWVVPIPTFTLRYDRNTHYYGDF